MPDAPAEPFIWPPRPPAPLPEVALAPPDAPPEDPPDGWWSSIEREWLDVTAAPLRERMAAAGWAPSAPVEYCPRCAESLDPEAVPTEDGRCPHCPETRPPWDRIVRLGEYRPPLSGWVHEVKFTRWRRLGHDLGRLLGDALAAQMRAAGLAAGAKVLLVPMPTTFWRRFARGIDHTLVLARGAAPRVGARIARPIRRAHRPSQTTVAPSARGANVAGAFGLRRACTRRWGTLLREAELVIVLDDVATTGSTLRGAVRAVREAIREARGPGWATYPLIWAAVVAKTPAGHHDGDEIGAA